MGDSVKKRKFIPLSMTPSSSSPPAINPQPSSSKRVKTSLKENQAELDSDAVKPTVNPLDFRFPHIVRKICDNLEEVEDLKSVRAVSKVWRDESLEQWRTKAVLVLRGEVIQALVEAYLHKNDDQEEFTSCDKLLQLFDKPFRNFRYPSDSNGRNRVYPLQPVEIEGPSPILWEQFFSQAMYLDLGDCLMKDEVYYLEGFKWIFQTCPDLKRLDLNPYKFCENIDFINFFADDDEEEEDDTGSSEDEEDEADLSTDDEDTAHPSDDDEEDHNNIVDRDDEGEDNSVVGSDVIASKLETLCLGKSVVPDFRDTTYEPASLLVRSPFGYRYPDMENPINPLPALWRMCPNLKTLCMQGNGKLLLNGAQSEGHQLESLTMMHIRCTPFPWFDVDVDLKPLKNYLEGTLPPLKTLVLRLDNWRKCLPRPSEEKPLFDILNLVQGTLTKLELYIDCEMEGILKRPLNLASEGGTRTFSNLTHLKLCLDYRKLKGNLISFDFGSLRQMKKLKEFRFEMGLGVAEGWVKKKLGIKDIAGRNKKRVELEELLLPDLELFHFHSNFTSEAIQYLGKVATNLKTLEVVLDKENFRTALKTWTGLTQITLLPCSEVPKELYSGLEGLKIVDRSKDYRKASNYWFSHESPKDNEAQQMKRFCKLTKPR